MTISSAPETIHAHFLPPHTHKHTSLFLTISNRTSRLLFFFAELFFLTRIVLLLLLHQHFLLRRASSLSQPIYLSILLRVVSTTQTSLSCLIGKKTGGHRKKGCVIVNLIWIPVRPSHQPALKLSGRLYNTHSLTQSVFTAPQCSVTLRIMTALTLTHAHTHPCRKTPTITQRKAKVRRHGHPQFSRNF